MGEMEPVLKLIAYFVYAVVLISAGGPLKKKKKNLEDHWTTQISFVNIVFSIHQESWRI